MSNEINLPPFYVGQRVVAIDDDEDGDFVKGSMHTIMQLDQCVRCKTWSVDIGNSEALDGHNAWEEYCSICNFTEIKYEPTLPTWYNASHFAPIQENFQSISLEKILEEETKLISVN